VIRRPLLLLPGLSAWPSTTSSKIIPRISRVVSGGLFVPKPTSGASGLPRYLAGLRLRVWSSSAAVCRCCRSSSLSWLLTCSAPATTGRESPSPPPYPIASQDQGRGGFCQESARRDAVGALDRFRSGPIIQRRAGEATRPPYDRLVVRRPSDEWSRKVKEEAAELARGTRSPEQVYARFLWPESLRSRTDAALAEFEVDLHALRQPSDEEILNVVERLVLTLNKINKDQARADEIGYETDEREELCDYISASLQEAGIDVVSLETRHGAPPGDIAGRWRDW